MEANVEADPLCHRTVTTGWGLALLRAITLLPCFPLPLLLHGTKDAIAYPSGSEAFAAAAPAALGTLQLFQGFRHELHSDPRREQVFTSMLTWLEQLLAPSRQELLKPYPARSATPP